MSILSDSNPLSQADNVNSDASVIKMIDDMLAQDGLAVHLIMDGWELHVTDLSDERGWPHSTTIDIYETRAAAYRGAIDCLIEACVFAWDQGDES